MAAKYGDLRKTTTSFNSTLDGKSAWQTFLAPRPLAGTTVVVTSGVRLREIFQL